MPSAKAIITAAETFYKTSSKFPATQVLSDLFRSKVRRVAGGVTTHARSDIVSEKLCHDALKYIEPRLDDYHGCDIIDINPGTCIWSRKIHDALKPRTHVLLEPEAKYFKPFVKPLLDSDPTYKLSTYAGTHLVSYWSTYNKLFDEGLLRPRPVPSPDDPALRQRDRTLLITGNMMRFYKVQAFGNVSLTKSFTLTFSHFLHSAQLNTLFHRYGLVKMLLWTPEEARSYVIPRTAQRRALVSTASDLVADINEVAGLPKSPDVATNRLSFDGRPRPFALDRLSAFATSQRMEDSGLTIPSDRMSPLCKEARAMNKEAVQDIRELLPNVHQPPGQQTQSGHLKAVDDLEAAASAFLKDKKSLAAYKTEPTREENKAVFEKKLFEPVPAPMQNRFADFMRLSKLQVEAEAAFWQHAPDLTVETRDSLEHRLLATAANIRKGIYGSGTMENKLHADRFRYTFDEHRTMALEDPPLAYDRRPWEPLAAREDEFWPNIPLMLLEIDPLERTFASDIATKAQASAIMRAFVKGLFHYPGHCLSDVLDFMSADCGKEMYEAVPELRDPKYGGRLDPQDLRASALPRGLLEKLTNAYMEWPFRPSEHSMMEVMAGSNTDDGDAEGADDGDTLDAEDDPLSD